jgi:8-oxo-dGTP pyrophosphatase MutT (NUDIX family)
LDPARLIGPVAAGRTVVNDRWIGRPGGTQHIPRPHEWRLGTRPSWQGADVERLRNRDLVAKAAAPVPVVQGGLPFPGARPSAVLVALLEGDDGCEVVLTTRARHLRHHSGEVSFPGGRMDPGEGAIDTALREAEEEIGLDRRCLDVVGGLETVSTWVSSSFIIPVVARYHGRPVWNVNPGEVDRVFTVPLADLTRDDTYRSEWWGRPPDDHELHFFELDDETVWGATARMLRGLIDRVVGQER